MTVGCSKRGIFRNLRLSFQHESWPLASVFTISRGSKTRADVVVVTLERGGRKGRGECVPYPRYDETVPQVLAALAAAKPRIEAGIGRDDVQTLPLPHAARNALDCALWDLECKESGIPAWQMAGLAPPPDLTTAFTISLATPDVMAAAAKKAGRPLLKLKLGRDGDEERLRAIRAAVPKARLIVDANEGWRAGNLASLMAVAAQCGVELIEQPLPAGDDEALRHLPGDAKRPLICADESAHGLSSLMELRGKYDAVNIKLDKTGGLTPALAMARAAKEQGFTIMVGCMVATSLAMAPATLLGQLARYVDLDGPLLLKEDRPGGIRFIGSTMQPPPRALWG